MSVDTRKRITVIREYEIAINSECVACCGTSCQGFLAVPTPLDSPVREDIVPAYCDVFNASLKWHPSFNDGVLRTPRCREGEGP